MTTEPTTIEPCFNHPDPTKRSMGVHDTNAQHTRTHRSPILGSIGAIDESVKIGAQLTGFGEKFVHLCDNITSKQRQH